MNIVKNFQLKIVSFTAVKNRCILHGRVFVMMKITEIKQSLRPTLSGNLGYRKLISEFRTLFIFLATYSFHRFDCFIVVKHKAGGLYYKL